MHERKVRTWDVGSIEIMRHLHASCNSYITLWVEHFQSLYTTQRDSHVRGQIQYSGEE